MRLRALAFALLLASCGIADRQAPDFELPDLSGRFVRLSDFRGHPVLLTFWSTSCGICRHELPALEQIRLEYGNQGLTVLTVVADNADAATSFLNQKGLNLWTARDPEFEAFQSYGVGGVPTTFLIDAHGRVQKRWAGGSSGAIRRELESYSF